MPAARAVPPTVRSLIARSDLRLRLCEGTGDDEALDTTVRWVHSTDLTDPTPFLSDGLVLLTTGRQFLEESTAGRSASDADEASPAEYAAYVERLTHRGVVGIGFGTEVLREGVPLSLVEACRDARLPLFEVPYDTPFIAVARAAADQIAAEGFARQSWALSAQRAIALAALRPDGLGATLAELARQLRGWVGLYDAGGELVREHPGPLPPATADAVRAEADAVLRRGVRAASSLQAGEEPFVLQTLGRGGSLRGILAISAADLDHESRGVVTSVIAMAGLATEQQEGVDRARGLLRAALLTTLLAGDHRLAEEVAAELWGGFPAVPVRVAVVDADTALAHAAPEWLELESVRRHGGVFYARSGADLVLVLDEASHRLADDLAHRTGVPAGVSAPSTYGDLSLALDQARSARAHATGAGAWRIDDRAGSVLDATDHAEARARASALLAPVTGNDARHGTELVATLRAWLEADCRGEACAERLGVHRHTVRVRLHTVQSLLGLDLSSFAVRAELWAALRALG